MISINKAEKTAWLRLARTPKIGPRLLNQLVTRFGSAGNVIERFKEISSFHSSLKNCVLCPEEHIAKELLQCDILGASLYTLTEPEYPEWLRHIPAPPAVITVLGNVALLKRPAIAIVGARNASLNGRHLAKQIASELGQHQWVIVSGLARGIDTEAHKGGLETGTVAVMAGGINYIYPKENCNLYTQIKHNGAIITEQPIGMPALAQHFPLRNRIVSGLSRGVLVIEATLRSGSLITARYALEQGREVFAVPGSPLDPRSQGPNSLLKEGAILTESAKDVMEAFAYASERQQNSCSSNSSVPEKSPSSLEACLRTEDLDRIRDEIIYQLGPHPVSIDEIITVSNVAPSIVLTILLEFELAGKLERHPGNKVSFIQSGKEGT